MTEKFSAIVLDITRHNDRHNIVTVFSRSQGRMVFLSPCGSGKNARLRQSRLQPLAVIAGDVRFSPVAELQKLGAFNLQEVWADLYFHPVKRMMVLFLSEFLNRLLKATMPDENLWDYIVTSLRLLDNMTTGISDFHIAFMGSLLPFMGIQPDASQYKEGMMFDMRGGVFTDILPPHNDYLRGDEARFASIISRVNFFNVKALRLNGHTRRTILSRLLAYYSIHFPGTANLKSLPIIQELFQ
ncbi:MAG: hypothetical protein HDR88_04855 [Bacteroides sp.]|nr:hypothetical protein [Bacteroides sp.]